MAVKMGAGVYSPGGELRYTGAVSEILVGMPEHLLNLPEQATPLHNGHPDVCEACIMIRDWPRVNAIRLLQRTQGELRDAIKVIDNAIKIMETPHAN